MTGLTKLPVELIAAIVSLLDDPDILTTRLTSRAVERASLPDFGHRFFRKKGYLITTPSLDVLAQIAAHEDLRKHVQHVWFNPDCFTFVHPACAPDAQEAPDPENPDSILQLLSPGDRKQYEAYQAVKQDHSLLSRRCGVRLQEVLTPIFTNLPNLKIIGMRRSEDHAPWGWRQLKDAVGEDPRELGPIPSGPMHSLSGPTKLFLAIVNAAAAANSQLRRFYTDAIEIDNIRPDLLTQETLDKVCGPIWYLEINMTRAWLYKHQKKDFAPDPDNYGNGLVKLLKATTKLKEIGLQIFPDRQQSHGLAPDWQDSESWRKTYSHICLQRVVENVRLLHLTRVKLEKVVTSPATLLAFLTPCTVRLTSLKLRDVRLLSDEEHPRPWRTIFAFLLNSCPKLNYLLFYQLFYESGGISFLGASDAPPDHLLALGTPIFPASASADSSAETFLLDSSRPALHVSGREAVAKRLEEVLERHCYHTYVPSHQIDEGSWHTDTSDEEW
ncbi:hypothetical protein B0A55_10213 [Friedmanniomyces simplex]|uniref:F-box domain-containing protein n=1 Tax=Friedmanniomyces simplex TaxID=329884 RepID=A0A4U0WM52_9PEZI|nr:hypothetical protein B0A55_10213 [Friedmanniomyces simplex]